MTREDFRIVPKYYTTSSLTMVFYKDTIIASVEIYKNYRAFEDEASKAERLADIKKQKDAGQKKIKSKPMNMKTSKEARTVVEISAECERIIFKHIAADYVH